MKNLKTKIALMFGIALLATLLFAIPALACGNDYDYGKHGGFIYATKAKSWFGSYAEAWKEKYVEPTPAVEESIAQPVQEEPVQKDQYVETPVQEQPIIEEPTFEGPDVETQIEEEHTGFIDDEEEELYADKVEEKHEKIEKQNEYKPWLKSRASITKDNTAKHHIYPSIGHNGITKQGQTATIYKSHNSYDWVQRGPKQIYIKPIKINFAPADSGDSTIKPAAHTILQEMEELASHNTEVYLRPLGLTIGLIMQTADLANKPQLVKLAKSIRNNEEIRIRGMEYRIRESLGHSYPAIFPTVNKELRGKTAGMSHTTINQNFKVKMSEIWPIAPVITNPIDGRHVAHPLHFILGAHLIPEEERLETATQLGGGQHQRVAIARLLFPKFA